MLHDATGHLLFMRTYRGDTHLIDGMVDGTVHYEGLAESQRLTHQIFDREGLSVAHFKDLLGGKERRQFITCLKSNQYEGVDSFELSSSFAPFRHDKHGQVVQEIAEASYVLKDRRAGEDDLPLRAILLRKPIDETDDQADDEARLHVVVTSDRETPAAGIARRYRDRYPKQENAIRDWWLPLGGDVNVGYDKRSRKQRIGQAEDGTRSPVEDPETPHHCLPITLAECPTTAPETRRALSGRMASRSTIPPESNSTA